MSAWAFSTLVWTIIVFVLSLMWYKIGFICGRYSAETTDPQTEDGES